VPRYRSKLRRVRRLEGMKPDFRADLHLHTLRSDGIKSSQQVLEECVKGGLDVIAITDHDIDPIVPSGLQVVNDQQIHVLHGAELSGVHLGKEYHLLVYFPGEMPTEFRDLCKELCQQRAHRYDEAIQNLGINLKKAPAEAYDGDVALTRTHLARELLEKNIVVSYDQAFRDYLKKEGMVPLIKLSFIDAIKQAKKCGAFVSWAHPSVDMARSYAKLFSKEGLDALEVVRPKQSRQKRRQLNKIADSLNLYKSGGSDSHGFGPPLGTFAFAGRDMLWTRQVGINPDAFIK
jgi:3',5'-nucleoside bisphosphate phosphatase